MKNPSAAKGSGEAATGRQTDATDHGPATTAEASPPLAGRPQPVDLQSVDEGIALLGRYEEAFADLLSGVENMMMPGQ